MQDALPAPPQMGDRLAKDDRKFPNCHKLRKYANLLARENEMCTTGRNRVEAQPTHKPVNRYRWVAGGAASWLQWPVFDATSLPWLAAAAASSFGVSAE